MKKKNSLMTSLVCFVLSLIIGSSVACGVFADEQAVDANMDPNSVNQTNISLMPVSKVLQIASNSTYEDTVTVNNDGDEDMEVEVYAAPYSYVYSEEEDVYKLGFSHENNFTQIKRWISFENSNGEWKDKITASIPAHSSTTVKYKVTTPDNIPAGGQYAVIFAHTLTAVTSANGIRTEASPGMILYGRNNDGDVKVSAAISSMSIKYGIEENGSKRDSFYASAKVKNDGNIDFSAVGKLKVDSILGGGGYETPGDKGRISVIPESELVVHDEWEDSPSFGIYKVTWTVTAGEATETTETVIFVNPLLFVIITIIVLTIIIVWIIIVVRKRKERRSRLAV